MNPMNNISYITDMAFQLEKLAAATQNRFLALLFKMAAQEGREMMEVEKTKANAAGEK